MLGPARVGGEGTDQGQLDTLKGSLVFLDEPESPDPGPRLRLTMITPW